MIAANHNNKHSQRIGMSPNKLQTGKDLRLPITANMNVNDVNDTDDEYDFYSQYISNLRNIAEGIANAKLNTYDEKRKEYEHRNRIDKVFEVGEYVIFFRGYKAFGSKGKLTSKWEGPYRIKQVFNEGLNYRIKHQNTGQEIVTNVHKLRTYYQRDNELSTDNVNENEEEKAELEPPQRVIIERDQQLYEPEKSTSLELSWDPDTSDLELTLKANETQEPELENKTEQQNTVREHELHERETEHKTEQQQELRDLLDNIWQDLHSENKEPDEPDVDLDIIQNEQHNDDDIEDGNEEIDDGNIDIEYSKSFDSNNEFKFDDENVLDDGINVTVNGIENVADNDINNEPNITAINNPLPNGNDIQFNEYNELKLEPIPMQNVQGLILPQINLPTADPTINENVNDNINNRPENDEDSDLVNELDDKDDVKDIDNAPTKKNTISGTKRSLNEIDDATTLRLNNQTDQQQLMQPPAIKKPRHFFLMIKKHLLEYINDLNNDHTNANNNNIHNESDVYDDLTDDHYI